MEWLFLLIGAAISGFAVAVYFKRRENKHEERHSGTLCVVQYNSGIDPELILLPDIHPNEIANEKCVMFDVRVISQK